MGVPVAPGNESRTARLLGRLGQAAADRGLAGPPATLTAPGRVLHVQAAAGGLDGLVSRLTADAAASGALRALCDMPGSLPTASYLVRARLTRCAHYAHSEPTPPGVHRRALLYPVRPGRGRELRRVLAAGVAPGTARHLASSLVSSTVFGAGDTVVRFWEATAAAREELDSLARVVPYSGLGARLNRLLATGHDLTTDSGFRAFFTGCAMTPVHGTGAPAQS
ncbi:SchA/CurD-like domain-containing protein [Streptomyces sp. B1866]|uniref:SchA/CurD-like domain-containing protein n=1 Tax=Streptomyces sp. B1866 TaxID=3075431 RepID=UPI0028903EB4|nr:SchA/CurD-like domain-containing protein [Streptomyces sp. B1866]MDT3397869.1 SchA/CurD-like domain-containing protein [Streptomyces sp. B1866]